MWRALRSLAVGLLVFGSAACGQNAMNPTAPASTAVAGLGATMSAGNAKAWGPETPPFNIEAILRPSTGGHGFGLVKFRQPNDDITRIFLDTWVRDLEATTQYRLQRAVDTVLDGTCSSEAWLTLGKGLAPQTLLTDDAGTGREEFYRDLPANLALQTFDIHFRITTLIDVEVLRSGCYQFIAEPD